MGQGHSQPPPVEGQARGSVNVSDHALNVLRQRPPIADVGAGGALRPTGRAQDEPFGSGCDEKACAPAARPCASPATEAAEALMPGRDSGPGATCTRITTQPSRLLE